MNDKVIVVGQVWRSSQNGMVYDPRGVSLTICAGHHAGVEPRIIVYEDEQTSDKADVGVSQQGRERSVDD